MLVSEFLASLKSRGQIQAAQTVLSDDDLLRMANQQLRIGVAPRILQLREGYFQGRVDQPFTSSRFYRLPPRIMGSRIFRAVIINGNTQTEWIKLPNTRSPESSMPGFYMAEGQIVAVGPIPTGTLRLYYPIIPPKMVSTAYATAIKGQVATVGDTSVTVSGSPANGIYEVIRYGDPHRTVSTSLSVSGTTGTDNDCPAELDRIDPGDLLITPDATPIVPLEEQLCDWLLQRTYMRYLSALGYTQDLQNESAKLADMQEALFALMSPRVADSPKIVFGGQLAGWSY